MYVCSLLITSQFDLNVLHDFRLRAAGRSNADGVKKARTRDRAARAIPAPEANAELQANLDVCQISFLFDQYHFFFWLFKLPNLEFNKTSACL